MLIDFLTPEDMYPEIMAMSIEKAQNWGILMSHISEAQKHTKGEGVLVAVLDTGVASHQCLDAAIFGDKVNFTDSQTVLDQQGHGCIMPDDIVWTSTHGLARIKDVWEQSIADSIVISPKESTVVKFIEQSNIFTNSHIENGFFATKRLQAVHKIDYEGEIHVIKTKHATLRLTPWHPVYCVTSRQGSDITIVKKRADEVTENDHILCAGKINNVSNHKVSFENQIACNFCNRKSKCGNNTRKQCRGCNRHDWQQNTPSEIELNAKLAYWIGLVISDGHIMKNSKTVSFCGKNEKLIEKFEELTEELFALKCEREQPRLNSHSTRVRSSNIINLLETHFNLKAEKKSLTVELPSLIAKSNIEIVGAFIAGCVEGDGRVDKNWKIRLCTNSSKFAIQLNQLLHMHGINASISSLSGNSKHRIKNEYYHVRISPFSELTNQLIYKRGDVSPNPKQQRTHKVESVSVEYYKGELYDFTVEDSHNYVANGCTVSNTHVAGIIAAREIDDNGVIGVAPEARIMSVKVLNDSARGNYGWIEQGIHHAISNGADIINLSLGSSQPPPPSLYAAIQEAVAKGIIVISAAGNDAAAVNYPARYDEVIAVAAIDQQGNMAHFSSHDAAVDVSAPGVGIYSTSLNNGYAVLNGTSQAAPFVAGICALLLSHSRNTAGVEPIKGYLKMLEALDSVCDPKGRAGHVGKDGDIGFGIPDFANVKWKQ